MYGSPFVVYVVYFVVLQAFPALVVKVSSIALWAFIERGESILRSIHSKIIEKIKYLRESQRCYFQKKNRLLRNKY